MTKNPIENNDTVIPETRNSIGFANKTIKTQIQKPIFPTYVKVIFVILFLSFLAITSVVLPAWWYVSSFTSAAGVPLESLTGQIKSGISASPSSDDGRTNFLIMGLDEIVGQKDGSQLTDTMLVVSFDHTNKKVTLVSLPRDLWIDPLKTKINALYYYGQLSDETTGEELASSVVQQVLGLQIHYHIVIGLDSLEHIVNTIGGVDIDVPASFVDTRFPKKDVDVKTVTDESLLYETVTFSKGIQHMDGSLALKYIRSRQSEDTDQGNDIVRGERQKQLITAIVNKISTKKVLADPHVLGNLYKIYTQNFSTNLEVGDLIALARLNGSSVPEMGTLSIPVEKNNQPGLIFHPPTEKYKQWVYEPADPSWKEIHEFINKNL